MRGEDVGLALHRRAGGAVGDLERKQAALRGAQIERAARGGAGRVAAAGNQRARGLV